MDFSGSSVTEEEIRQAEEKFAESLHLAQMGMHNILENDVSLPPCFWEREREVTIDYLCLNESWIELWMIKFMD